MMNLVGKRWSELNKEVKAELMKDFYVDKDYIDNQGKAIMDFGCGLSITCTKNEYDEWEPIADAELYNPEA